MSKEFKKLLQNMTDIATDYESRINTIRREMDGIVSALTSKCPLPDTVKKGLVDEYKTLQWVMDLFGEDL